VKKPEPRRKLLLAGLLLAPSLAAYAVHWGIFRNAHDIFYYLLMDVGFLFVQVMLATLVFDRLLNAHEREAIQKKLNVVLGIFFSQVGTPLLPVLSAFDSNAKELGSLLKVDGAWTSQHFEEIRTILASHPLQIDLLKGDLVTLKSFQIKQRDFLVRLLENPNLLEHETLTELLWAVFHLADELEHRSNLATLTDPDRKHLAGDIHRAHGLLVAGWLQHIHHLKTDYPYLFSLAVRTNPFDPDARVEVQ
jgi:hypothetical protein